MIRLSVSSELPDGRSSGNVAVASEPNPSIMTKRRKMFCQELGKFFFDVIW